MRFILVILLLLLLTAESCSSQVQKNRNTEDNIFSMLSNKTLFEKACNEDLKSIVGNNQQFQYFIIHLFCNQPCHNRWSLNEDYFGNASIENVKVDIHHIPSTIEDYYLIPKEELSNYILNAWSFFTANYDSLSIKKHLNINCFTVTLFFITLKSIRESNYSNTSNYNDFLISAYKRFLKYDNYLADMVLNVMRYDSSISIKSFLIEKKIQSKEFNSSMFLELFNNEKNAIADYKQLVKN